MPSFSKSSLTIGAWNIDGLFSRIDNVRTSKLNFDSVCNLLSSFDIFCLTETHCEVSDKIDLDKYHIEQNHRPRSLKAPHAFGGLAVGVRLALFKGITFFKPTHSEFMWFKVCKNFFGMQQDIYICNVYISPAGSSYSLRRDDIFALIEKDIAKYSKQGNCILMGDFNARTCTQPDFVVNDTCKYLNTHSNYVIDAHISRKNLDTKGIDIHGKLLLDLCKGSGLRILNGRKFGDLCGNYTCYNHWGNPSTIDYMLCHTDLYNDVDYFKVHDLMPSSIHCMISCCIKTGWYVYDDIFSNDDKLHDIPEQYFWSSKSTELWKWAMSQPDILSEINAFSESTLRAYSEPENTVDECMDSFYNLFKSIRNKAGIKKISAHRPKSGCKKKKWYDQDCKTLFHNLKSLARSIKAQPRNITLVHDYRRLQKKYKNLLNSKKHMFRASIFKRLDEMESNDPQAFWKIYEDLCDSKKSSNQTPISPKQWWNHFLSLMNRNISHKNKNFEDLINNCLTDFDNNDVNTLDYDITCSEVIEAALHLKRGKAPGIDGIRNEMLKAGISILAPALTALFNVILTQGYFPSAWRLSTLTVLHKKGDKNIPKNYRGIAVSSNLCKLFCLILYNRLNMFTNDNNIIPSNQIGFRKGSRTSDHILVLKTLIDKYIQRAGKSYLYICFIDFSAAFDTVWRNALLYKLTQIGIGGQFLKTICSMYSSVSFAVKCNDKLTDSFNTSVGVKQGCVLSPIFFNIFLSDLPEIFDAECDPVNLNNASLSCLMYADDLIILSESASGLQCALDKLNSYCNKWKLLVNIDKSNVMIFNKSGHIINNYKFIYDNCEIKITNEYCYLGIIFVPSGSFTKAMCRLKDKALKAYFKIRENLFCDSSKCSFKLFHSLIHPILSYGCEVWAPYLLAKLNDSNFLPICDKLPGETLHIKLCKAILGVHKRSTNNAVRGELGSFPLLISMLSLAVKYWWKLNDRCVKGDNSLVIQGLIDNRKLSCFSWSSGLKRVFELINKLEIWVKPNIITGARFNDLIVTRLQHVYSSLWINQINNFQTKLRSYRLFKKSFDMENYAIMYNRSSRAALCKLRISSHSLMIEKGRHLALSPEDRICQYCNMNEVEDEFHFVMKCTLYQDLRSKMFSDIGEMFNIDNQPENDIFILLMSVNEYDSILPVINFVKSAFDIRSNTAL